MSIAELEADYKRVFDGFSPRERERLPLDYSVYGGSLWEWAQAFDEGLAELNLVDLTPLQLIMYELYTILDRQLESIKPQFRVRTEGLVDYKALGDELAAAASTAHGKILAEYFFLTNCFELTILILKGLEVYGNGDRIPFRIELATTAQSRLIEIFQEIDGQYERVQNQVEEHNSNSR